MVYDEGNASDHTHKFSKKIQIHRWKGEVFLVCLNRLANTKSAKELHDLLSDYKECCKLASSGPLKIFTSDCLNIDGGLWEKIFDADLNESVLPYKGTSSTLPLLSIDPEGYHYLDLKWKMKTAALAILNMCKDESCVVYGMDTEYCEGEIFARTLQI